MYLGVPAFSQPWRSCGTAPARTLHPVPSHPVLTIPSRQVTIPSHPIPSHTSVEGCRSLTRTIHTFIWVCQPLPRRGAPAARLRLTHPIPSHPIPSRPIQSHPVRSPYHTIPYHTIPSHLVWKGAAACHGRGTHVPGCASPLPGVAFLRHGSGAHNTSHPISSRPVQSHPVRSPSHTIPYYPIASHLVCKGAAACHG